jgi:hypothetical protein
MRSVLVAVVMTMSPRCSAGGALWVRTVLHIIYDLETSWFIASG